MNPEVEQLKKKVAELERRQAERERNQLIFPLSQEDINTIVKSLRRAPIQQEQLTPYSQGQASFIGSSVGTGATRTHRLTLSVGEEDTRGTVAGAQSVNTIATLEDQPETTALNSFFYIYRKPLYASRSAISVTSGGTTVSDSNQKWKTDSLAGAMVNIYNSSGVMQFTRQIASNNATQITIDGTWPASVSGGGFLVLMPIYLGSADVPWRRSTIGGEDVSSGGDGSVRRVLRFGYGTTGGTETLGVFFGAGSPESVVTANIGSLYLRTDGSTSTTLYVKTSGTGNTGWTAK